MTVPWANIYAVSNTQHDEACPELAELIGFVFSRVDVTKRIEYLIFTCQ